MDSARASSNESLKGLADRPGTDVTERLLFALTALHLEKSPAAPEENEHYVGLALRMIDKVDEAALRTLAEMLRGHPAAPAQVCEKLAALLPPDTIAALPAADVAAVMSAMPPPAETIAPPAADDSSAPSEGPEAEGPEAEMVASIAVFFAADPAERLRLLSQVRAEDVPADPEAPEDRDRRYSALDQATIAGRVGECIRELERLLDLPRSLCERLVNDPSGEPLVIAAKANGMPIAVLQRMLLLVNPSVGYSVQRVFDLTDLFYALNRGAAAKLIAVWRAEAEAAAPVRQSGAEAADPRGRGKPRETAAPYPRSQTPVMPDRVRVARDLNAPPGPAGVARRDLRTR